MPTPNTESRVPATRPTGPVAEQERGAALKVTRAVTTAGAASLATGALLEWVAPLWPMLPDWLRVVASANEPMMFGGAALLVGGAVVGRRLHRRVVGARGRTEP
jgi:hypothetical protein